MYESGDIKKYKTRVAYKLAMEQFIILSLSETVKQSFIKEVFRITLHKFRRKSKTSIASTSQTHIYITQSGSQDHKIMVTRKYSKKLPILIRKMAPTYRKLILIRVG